MTKYFLILFSLPAVAVGQSTAFDSIARKGSYLYYGQPAFEDNSFLLEEAINQEKGVMQYVSNFYVDNINKGNFLYSFTHQIPITNLRHQVNYSIVYNFQGAAESGTNGGGLGDLTVGYHFMAWGKKNWAMVIPGFQIIIPTGDASHGFGKGGFGGQLSLAITKRISHALVTHFNTGYTIIYNADRYNSTITGPIQLSLESNLYFSNLGASIIWYQTRKFNWLVEYVSNFITDLQADGSLSHQHQLVLNPGFRFAVDHNRVQIVPGMSVPFVFRDGKFDRAGLFFYLSFEPEYLPFTKQKHR